MDTEIINAWRGWRLEFECEYGSDCDGVTEYETFSSFDWTVDLAEIMEEGKMKWLRYNHLPRQYSSTSIEGATTHELKVHFGCGYAVEINKEKRSYSYNYSFGHGDYRDTIRLIAPGKKAKEISEAEKGKRL